MAVNTATDSMSKQEFREKVRRQKDDRLRPLRVIEYLDFSKILENSPVEVNEGYIVSDKDTCDIFASFVFKNVSEKPVKELNIRLSCFQNHILPYANIDFTYSHKFLTFGMIDRHGFPMKIKEANKRESVLTSECFGTAVYIPLPESYFKRMDIILLSAVYEDGTTVEINTVVGGKAARYRELDDFSKIAYTRVNIYQTAEEFFPTVVMPEESESVWLCCCGNKNPRKAEICERCGREKAWQMNTITAQKLEETKNKMISDPTERILRDRSGFEQNKYLESDEEIRTKIEKYEAAMRNVAEMEKRRERRNAMIIPKIAAYLLVMALLLLVIKVLAEM